MYKKTEPFDNSPKRVAVSIIAVLSFIAVFFSSEPVLALDQENCMLCHQYPLLGTIDDEGNFNSYYVSEDHYSRSVHAEVLCSECHKDITRIPHEENTKVDCNTQCHIIEPNTGRPFTHTGTDEIVKGSAHGASYPFANSSVPHEDFPECTSCHINEILSYRAFSEHNLSINADTERELQQLMLQRARGRCDECHQSPTNYEYTDQKLIHVVRRTAEPKSQLEIMEVCADCHNDEEMNERHELVNAVYSYRENYHGKIMILGEGSAPSCLDCHVRAGDSLHEIYSVRDSRSATYPENRGYMCARADCHPTASIGMGKAYIHSVIEKGRFPIQWWVMFFFTILTVVSFVGLMAIMLMELFRMIFPKVTIFSIFKRGGRK